ncbi:MAG: DNRLRE domain-containing protein [Opitutales bacterium]|nr:DNRLRE domain-containing protein [Opitutales bacterium]
MKPLPRAAVFVSLLSAFTVQAAAGDWWRSALYPGDWQPPADAAFLDDAFLQDFSYAGYRRGEEALPHISGPVFAALDYGADPSGAHDATAAIQSAIDAAAAAGGGVVYLGEGTYRVAPPGDAAQALLIDHDGIVLRGAGTDRTFLLNTRTDMRARSVVTVRSPNGGNWRTETGPTVPVTGDLPGPARRIPVADASAFQVGEWVVLRADATPEYIADLNMADLWGSAEARGALGGPLFYRMVTDVDPDGGFIEIDAPTRFILLTRDNARVARTVDFLEGVGLEDFSIGNLQHPSDNGWGEEDYRNSALPAYDTHASYLVRWQGVRDSWMRSVASFRAPENTKPVHMLSNGVVLFYTRGITLEDVEMQRPQYGGGGGNGYMIRFSAAQECLALDCRVHWNRHGFVFSGMQTSGNVIHRGLARQTAWQAEGGRTNGRGSDHHMHLSQSNLVDGVTLDSDFFQAAWRGLWGTHPHGLTATHSVFWNLEGLRYLSGRPFIVESEQFAYGYVIGTRGPAPAVSLPRAQGDRTDPVDHKEGVGKGDDLWPVSLFQDQRARRLGGHDPGPPALTVCAPAEVHFPNRRARLEAITEDGADNGTSIAWEQTSGPRAAYIDTPGEGTAWAVIDLPGAYTFRATVERSEWSVAREVTVEFLPKGVEDTVLPAETAAFVRDGVHADTVYGAGAALEVKNDSPGYARETFLRFDTAAIQRPVISATLHMNSVDQGLDEMAHHVHRVSADGWQEDSLTWNTRPAPGALVGAVTVREGRSWALDVTAVFNETPGDTAFRLAAAMNYGAPGWMTYAGRTHAETEIRPRLVVRHDPAPASYEDWWSGAPETPPELRAPASDASGDGQPNIIAFLRGLPPLAAEPAPALSLHKDDSGLFLRWRQDTRVSTLPYRLEWNDGFDPEDWTPVILEYRFAHPAETGDIRTLEVALEQLPRLRFYRLRIDTDPQPPRL